MPMIVGTQFQLKLTNFIFRPNLTKLTIYFQPKTEKVNITIEFCIFELVLSPNFSLKRQF